MSQVEIRVRPVIRYVVTRYRHASKESGLPPISEVVGEFDNEGFAEEVAKALAEIDLRLKQEQSRIEAERARWQEHIRDQQAAMGAKSPTGKQTCSD